jgi:predicted Rossmann fold nucleotide-binding protein DprA/Smf involved in DNA uptake
MRRRNSLRFRQYPARLREIYDPPPLLYVRGDVELLNRHTISMVRARRPTPYGNQMAERISRDLADRGLVISSGLARGIDASAHKGALSSAHGATIGVLGCGIDVVYPKEDKKIFEQIGQEAQSSANSRLGRFRRRRILRFATGLSLEWRSGLWWSKARSILIISSPRAWPWNSESSAFPATSPSLRASDRIS